MARRCKNCSKENDYFAYKCKQCGSRNLYYDNLETPTETPPMPKRKTQIPIPEVKPPKQTIKVSEIKMNIDHYYIETKDTYFNLGNDYDDSIQVGYEDIDKVITLLERLKQIKKEGVL